MNCPGCGAAMSSLVLDGHGGTRVDLDLCPACQVLWFDRHESLHLAAAGTLQLFRIIGEGKRASPPPVPAVVKCPRCAARLQVTHDRQRNTPFQYWRCPNDHGRLTTFFDFLREKDFVRPLTAQQLEELRRNVQMVNCSNCGAPIDLVKESACGHCKTPISVIDLKQIEKVVTELVEASKPRAVDPTLPMQLALEKQHVDTLFNSIHMREADVIPSDDLITAGVRLIASLLTK